MRLALKTILLSWTADEERAPVSATCHHIRYFVVLFFFTSFLTFQENLISCSVLKICNGLFGDIFFLYLSMIR